MASKQSITRPKLSWHTGARGGTPPGGFVHLSGAARAAGRGVADLVPGESLTSSRSISKAQLSLAAIGTMHSTAGSLPVGMQRSIASGLAAAKSSNAAAITGGTRSGSGFVAQSEGYSFGQPADHDDMKRPRSRASGRIVSDAATTPFRAGRPAQSPPRRVGLAWCAQGQGQESCPKSPASRKCKRCRWPE
jgi:hypothetical protein